MAINLYQRNSGVSNTLSYLAPNVCGQMGIIFVGIRAGIIPSSVTDTNNNLWVLVNSTSTNVGDVAFFICLSLVAGVNTVTVNGTSAAANFILTEFTAPIGVQTLNGPQNVGNDFTSLASYFNSSSSFQHVLLVGSFANAGNPTWSCSATIVDQTHDSINNNSTVLAMLSSSAALNTITFTATPTQSSAFILGLVLNG